MSRNECFNTASEIIRNFPKVRSGMKNAGPTIYYRNGVSYYDDSQGHCAIIGRTGMGKSNTVAGSMGYIKNIMLADESFIMIDPKKEGFNKYATELKAKGYDVYCVDFDNPRNSLTDWDPLKVIRKLFNSGNLQDNDFADTMLNEFAISIYPENKNADPFWVEAAAEFFKACVYILLEYADDDEINLDSIARIMEIADGKMGVNSSYIKEFYNLLDDNSMAKRYLTTYVNSPNDTRMSIFSVAKNGIAPFSQSRGIMKLLSNDTLNISSLDMDKPFAIFIAKPDENSTFDAICGFLVTQLTQHFIKLARDKYNGALPCKLHVILEELGSLGKAISNLPNLMVASRSRNLRIALILQGYSQLEDIYGKSKAETIYSSIGVTIGFSTNNWDTLTEWSNRCGNKVVYENGMKFSETIVTPNQLAAMPIATALVMISGKWKYICKFPFVERSESRMPEFKNVLDDLPIKTFDMKKIVDKYKEIQRAELFGSQSKRKIPFDTQIFGEENSVSISIPEIIELLHTDIKADKTNEGTALDDSINNDIDELIAKIDARIKELEEEEANSDGH